MINTECPTCGKKFAAPDELAGKTVRCRGCSNLFALPTADAMSPADDDAGISFRDDDDATPAPPPPSPAARPTPRQPPRETPLSHNPGPTGKPRGLLDDDALPNPASSSPARRGNTTPTEEPHDIFASADIGRLETVAAGGGAPQPAKARSTWFWHPHVILLDRWLPRLLVAIGLLWLVVSMSSSTTDATTPSWVWLTRLAIALAMYVVLVLPLTHIAIRMAAGSAKRTMPKAALWRTFASYFPALVVSVVIWNAGAGWNIGVVMGLVLGLAIAAAIMLLLFRLEPNETGVYAGFGSGGFLLGVILAGSMVYVVNMALAKGLEGQKMPALPKESPLWSYVAWVKPTESPDPAKSGKPATPKPADAVAKAPTPPTATPTTPPAKSEAKPADALATATPAKPENAPSNAPAASPGTPPAAGNLFSGSSGATAVPVTPAEPASTTAASVVKPDSPTGAGPGGSVLKLSETYQDIGDFAALVRPVGNSDIALVVRNRQGDDVTLDAYDTATWSKLGSTTVSEPNGPVTGSVESSYAVNLDGSRVVVLRRVPRLSLQVIDLTTNRPPSVVDFPQDQIDPLLLGYYRENRLLYRATNRKGLQELAWLDVAGSQRNSRDLSAGARLGNLLTVHPGGKLGAMAGRGASGYSVSQINLDQLKSPIGSRDFPIPMDASLDASVSGLAYSPDQKLLAAFYPVGAGLLVAFNTAPEASPKPVLDMPFASNPMGRVPGEFAGSAIEFFPNSRAILLYGDAVVDVTTGAVLDRLGVPGVLSARVVRQDTVDLVVRTDDGKRRVLRVRLDGAKLADLLTNLRRPR